jgi:nucleotide-binding universal stress UspA family protein
MKLKAMLPLVTYPDCNSDAVAANAAAVAEQLGADLHAAAFNADIPDVSNAVSRFLLKLPDLIKEAESVSRTRGERLLGLVKEQAASRKLQLTTSTSTAALALLGEAAAAEARYFDVALLGWEAGNPTSRSSAEAIVFGCGRPVILLPELTSIGKIDHVAIAWDGSRAAARAVADAARILEKAATVSVLTVVDEKPLDHEDAGERLAAGLRDRGITSEDLAIRAEDCPIGVTLQERAIECGARLLVMGGYGHSRFRDFVLGGATEDVLAAAGAPLALKRSRRQRRSLRIGQARSITSRARRWLRPPAAAAPEPRSPRVARRSPGHPGSCRPHPRMASKSATPRDVR